MVTLKFHGIHVPVVTLVLKMLCQCTIDFWNTALHIIISPCLGYTVQAILNIVLVYFRNDET